MTSTRDRRLRQRSQPQRREIINFVPDVIEPKPKQRALWDAMWQGVITGDPEYLLWGGSAGPGKSWALRWGAVVFLIKCFRDLRLTGVQVGLFSRDYPSLRDRHINDIRRWPEWLGTYNDSAHDYRLASEFGGGVLSLRNLDDPAKYASAQFAALFIEELTELDRETFEELRTRKRWPGVPHSPVVAVCNPRHKGLAWVRKLWIERDFSGEQDRALRGRHFWFLQALPSDNDSLPPSYYETLDSLGPTLKAALLEGNWYVTLDQAFPEFSRSRRDVRGQLVLTPEGDPAPWHVIPTSDVPEQWRRIAGHDWGYDSPGFHLWGAIDPQGGVVIYREWQFRRLDPQDIAAGVLFRQGDEQIVATYADPSIWQERRRSDLSQDQINTLEQAGKLQLSKASQYRESGLVVERANNARVAGKSRIHTLLKDRGDGVPYLRIMDCCPILINTLQNITKDPDNTEDVLTEYRPDDDLRDDPYDALRYLLMGVPTRAVQGPRPQWYEMEMEPEPIMTW